MIVSRYRKRPVEVEAVRFDGYNGVQIIQWADQYQQDLPLIKRMSLDFGMWPDESAQSYRVIIKTQWLMGWPLGWTDLRPLEMDRWHSWLRKHGVSY